MQFDASVLTVRSDACHSTHGSVKACAYYLRKYAAHVYAFAAREVDRLGVNPTRYHAAHGAYVTSRWGPVLACRESAAPYASVMSYV
jgi:hypothetical protein